MTEYDVDYETDLRRKYLSPCARQKFDRWLNEIRAEAWDEGFHRGEKSGVSEIPLNPREWNPYRPVEK